MARRGEDVPVKTDEDLEAVYSWLESIRKDGSTYIVLDVPHDLIKGEYARKLDKDEYGRMVIAEKLSRGLYRSVRVEADGDGHAVVEHGNGDEIFDREDRKIVAAALESAAPVVNACDTDWIELEFRGALDRIGISLHHLIEAWCRTEWQRKRDGI